MGEALATGSAVASEGATSIAESPSLVEPSLAGATTKKTTGSIKNEGGKKHQEWMQTDSITVWVGLKTAGGVLVPGTYLPR